MDSHVARLGGGGHLPLLPAPQCLADRPPPEAGLGLWEWELLGVGSRALAGWRPSRWGWRLGTRSLGLGAGVDACGVTELGLVCNIYSLLVGLDIGLGPSVLG